MITKHRKRGEKKGGGLAIGNIDDKRIKLEKVKIENNDIIILKGTIHRKKSQNNTNIHGMK